MLWTRSCRILLAMLLRRFFRRHRFTKKLLIGIVFLVMVYKFSSHKQDGIGQSDDDVLQFRTERYLRYKASENSRSGPGELGRGAELDNEEKMKADALFQKEAFNIVASDKMSLERSLVDVRESGCKNIKYPDVLPTASVIIIFNNEAWSSLLRTVHSVVNRSPPQYLYEVILLDDFSDRECLLVSECLQEQLTRYVSETWPDGVVRIVRTKERCGLVRARLVGAKAAKGDVLIFLDSHCEASSGWIEPLLARIKEDRTNVLCPIIDVISDQTLEYNSNVPYQPGGFSWSLHFKWTDIPEHIKATRKHTDPIRSPTMPGGLFAMDRMYFYELGAYDEGMDLWGGENLEMSFRIWMCGGKLEFIPCSRVGHIFRNGHPYTFPGNKDTHGLNSVRVAEVWMDDYKRMFYYHRRDLETAEVGDLTSRKNLRERLKCNSFKWYLDNVYPEKFIPDENVQAWGMVTNPETKYCLDTLNQNEKTVIDIGLYPCQRGTSANQIFSLNLNNELRKEDYCIGVRGVNRDSVSLMNCRAGDKSQIWEHDNNTGTIIHVDSGRCLDVAGEKYGGSVHVKDCINSSSQKWTFQNYS